MRSREQRYRHERAGVRWKQRSSSTIKTEATVQDAYCCRMTVVAAGVRWKRRSSYNKIEAKIQETTKTNIHAPKRLPVKRLGCSSQLIKMMTHQQKTDTCCNEITRAARPIREQRDRGKHCAIDRNRYLLEDGENDGVRAQRDQGKVQERTEKNAHTPHRCCPWNG